MDKKTQEILNNDPISEIENTFGKRWDEFDKSEQLLSLMSYAYNQGKKDDHLKEMGDTYFSMDWNSFKELLKKNNFEIAYSEEFQDGNRMEEHIIWYNKQKGLVVTAGSYDGSINGGHSYGEIKAKSRGYCGDIFSGLDSGGFIDQEKLTISTSHDVREGLFSKIYHLESFGDYLPEWTKKNTWLWFVNYMESHDKNVDYKFINQKKIDQCPEDFRKMINQ